MGVFRILLAFCVVLSHGLNIAIPVATADVAVQTFYIVSGFYMGLILTEKYRDFSPYFTNRLLRLYPAYFVVLIVTLAHSIVRLLMGRSAADPGLVAYVSDFAPLGLAARTYLIGTNLVLWTQDLTMFLKLAPAGQGLAWTTNFALSNPHVEKFLLVPQAWSLSIELSFYLLAPWLVARSTALLITIVAATLVARLLLARIGLDFDPWTYRFFPIEVGSFVLGILSYRSMGARSASAWQQRAALAGLLMATLTYSAGPGGSLQRLAFYGYCVWALPLVFQLTRRNRVDRYLGELSYPIYLTHLLVISVALYSHLSGTALSVLIVALVVGASVALQEVVQKPVERYRAWRVAPRADHPVAEGQVAASNGS
ncbi:MAG: acyltransferase [Vicinamibacterales bacterium]